jgi:hypothetical protein
LGIINETNDLEISLGYFVLSITQRTLRLLVPNKSPNRFFVGESRLEINHSVLLHAKQQFLQLNPSNSNYFIPGVQTLSQQKTPGVANSLDVDFELCSDTGIERQLFH